MRRADPISVRVRAPSRGLVTRFPRESADMFRPGDLQRISTDAQNVRYEDGVIKNVPGYTQAQVGSLVANILAHWRMDEASGTRFDSSLNSIDLSYSGAPVPLVQVPGKIGKAVQAPVDTHPVFGGVSFLFNNTSTPLLQLANASFTISGWFNIAATGLTTQLFSFPGVTLTVSSGVFQATLFEASPSPGTVVHNFSSVVPVGSFFFLAMTYDPTSGGGTTNIYVNNVADASPFTGAILGASGPQIVKVFGGSPPFGGNQQLAVDSLSVWQRLLSTGELTTLYNSGNGLDFPFSANYSLLYQGNLIGPVPNPLIGAHGGLVDFLSRSFVSGGFFLTPTNLFGGSAPTTGYPWTATDFFDTIILAQHDNPAQYWTAPTPNVCQIIPGLPSTDSQWDGVEAFFGHALLWKDDRLKWSDKDDFTNWIPVAQTAASAVFTINTGGYTQPAVGATVAIPVIEDPITAGIVSGQFIFVQDNRGSGTANQFYNYYQVVSFTGGGSNTITARLQDLTGHTTTGLTIAAGQKVFTVDANEAGETRVVGSKMNGRIFKIVAMGDYAYIFKERSIQSVQYVGLESGTFFIHPEVSDEGALSRTAVLNLGDGRIVFLGHKELYLYTGGPRPQPIATQVTRQVLKEIDRTRLQEIVMVHKEIRHEVWVSYPILGGQKTLIWNYVEDTCSFDYYDSSVKGISAAADVDFSVDPPWDSLPESLTWFNIDPTLDWLDFSGASTDRILLLGFGDGEIVVWGFGNIFNRNGRGYTCLSETLDFDLEEPDIWKYVDVVVIGLEIQAATNQTRTLFVQVGQRAGLGTAEDSITFTSPISVSVSGNISDVVKVNPGGAGRYLRLRIFSQDADVQWAVSSFEIHCRPGGFY